MVLLLAYKNNMQDYSVIMAVYLQSQPTFAKAGVAVGAVGVAGAVLFQEAGVVLELAALAAAGAFALPRFLTPGSANSAKKEAK